MAQKDLEDLFDFWAVALRGAECGVGGIETVFIVDGWWGFEAEAVLDDVFFAVAAG